MTDKPHNLQAINVVPADDDLVERLRLKAKTASEVSRSIAQAKSLRQEGHNPPRDDLYMWQPPEQAVEWRAADRIASLSSELARCRNALERVTRSFELAVAGKPVRDMAETLAEVHAALNPIGERDE